MIWALVSGGSPILSMAMLMHASQFGGQLAHNFGTLAVPLGNQARNSAVGISVIWLSVDDIQVTTGLQVDDDGNPIYDESRIRYDSAYDLGLLLTYARPFGEQWSGGVNLKLVRQSLCRGVGAVRRREGVIDVEVAELRQRGDELRIVLLLSLVEARVLEEENVAILHRGDRGLRRRSYAVLDERDRAVERHDQRRNDLAE